MHLRLFTTARALARTLSVRIVRDLQANPRLVLGLPTGRTPIPLYEELVALHRRGKADFSDATTFNLDEFVGIAPGDPGSYLTFMRRRFFDQVNLSPWRHHLLNGMARNIERECARYERAIARAGGIDIQILGLGRNGHIGFNEPGDGLIARTHLAKLTLATRRANAPLFGRNVRKVPREALSVGIGTILEARRIVLIATGTSKARAVERMISGLVTPAVPASFLQLHPDVEIWLDVAAASRVRKQPTTARS